MVKKVEEDITLPDKIEGKSVMVEDSVEKSAKEKKILEKQSKFEFKVKKAEPGEKAEIEKENKKNKIIDWIILSLVFLGLVFLVFLLF